MDHTERKTRRPSSKLRVVSGAKAPPAVANMKKEEEVLCRVLDEFDATGLVGLRTIVYNAAIEHTCAGEKSVEIPKLDELLAAAVVSRCLRPCRLDGRELKAVRKILGLTLAECARKLDARSAPETVSRWETNAQPIGSYAEKVFRLMACEALKDRSPGVTYAASLLSDLQFSEKADDDADECCCVRLELVKLKQSGTVINAWDARLAA